MAEVVDRETRIADLVIHGWVPVRKRGPTCEFGMFNPGLRVGFYVWYPDPRDGYGSGARVDRVNIVNFPNDSVWVECEWGVMFSDTIDIIEARLGQT